MKTLLVTLALAAAFATALPVAAAGAHSAAPLFAANDALPRPNTSGSYTVTRETCAMAVTAVLDAATADGYDVSGMAAVVPVGTQTPCTVRLYFRTA